MAPKKKYTIEYIKQFAIDNGIECLSEEFGNTESKMRWRCGCGHIWQTKFSHVLSGTRCVKCSCKKYSIEYCKSFAASKGGKFLSKEVKKSIDTYKWKCQSGHEFDMSLQAAIKDGKWCKECYNRSMSLDINETIEIAAKNRGKCLSKNYINAHEKLIWECENGHIFHMPLGVIKYQGRWCKYCKIRNRELKILNALYDIFGQENVFFSYKKFDWLRNPNTGAKMELDFVIFFNEKIIAIEHDGEQHYFPVQFGNMSQEAAEKSFENTKIRDRIKEDLCNNHLDYFIRFSYFDKIDTRNIIDRLIREGICL